MRWLALIPLALIPLALSGCNDSMEEVPTTGSNAFAAYENPVGERSESFYFGGDTSNAVVDYVFVVDNSVSMKRILKRVRSGFDSLDPDVWPADARIAVLSTVPHALDDVERLHPTVERMAPGAFHDPGFTQFVSGDSIAKHNQSRPGQAKLFKKAGCGEWFAPADKNAKGTPCIQAHTQMSLAPLGAEAGLTALAQLLERNEGHAVFRPGAALNVVFVSDTHDPGAGYHDSKDLLEFRPTAAELISAIEKDNSVSSIRFHAIAPETECVEKWKAFGPAYFDVADATGGAKLDACKAKDYRPILQRVITDGARPTKPVFALGTEARQVHEVTVDGAAVAWERDGAGSIVVDVQPGDTAQVVEIQYLKAPVQTRKERRRTRR